MPKFFLSALIFFICSMGYGQADQEKVFDNAVGFYKKGMYEEAVKTFSEIIPKAKDTKLKKFCYIYRALSRNQLGDFKNSIADLNIAIAIDPNDLATYIDRGEAEGYAENIDAAEKDFKYVLSKDSTSRLGQGALYYLGLIAYQKHQIKEAIQFYNKLIKLKPDDAEAYFNRGAAKGMLIPMDVESSIRDYDMAIKLKPDYVQAYANRGVAKINLLTTKGTPQPTKEQTTDACIDLKKAKEMGDTTVDDMIYAYCDKK